MKRRHYLSGAITIILVTAISLSGCATSEALVAHHTTDPFAKELNRIAGQRAGSQSWLLVSLATLVTGAVAGTLVSTLQSLGNISPQTARPLLYATYGLNSLALIGGAVSYLKYTSTTDAYLHALRLQTQYYNLLSPQNSDAGRRQ